MRASVPRHRNRNAARSDQHRVWLLPVGDEQLLPGKAQEPWPEFVQSWSCNFERSFAGSYSPASRAYLQSTFGPADFSPSIDEVHRRLESRWFALATIR